MRGILHETAWDTPTSFGQVLSAKDLDKVMTESTGEILSRGKIWKIRFKPHRKAAMYIVWLEEKENEKGRVSK
jgi:hypothetical protein